MLRLLLIFFFTFLSFHSKGDNRDKIIENLNNTSNLSFEFEQNINGKIESGNCTIEYPKKIYCVYDKNNKILVSNGKSLVIKTLTSYYIYPLEKTPLYFILNKNFLLKKIKDIKGRDINDNFINYKFIENDNEVNLFFDKKTYNLIGWQTVDIYQNISITYLSSIKRNQKLDNKLFILPKQN